jgi:ABC-type phosphate transport system substrate-binding protein
MTDTTRNIIDYAQDENAIGFKDALYASIHDKVTAHIEAQKQQVAQRLIEPQQASVEAEDPPVENS